MNTETLQNVALFEKCRNFLPKAREVEAAGLHAWYKPISRSEDTVVVIEGKERIMMGSNNYLGLTHHPEVLAAAKAALDRYGSGCTGSRLLNGTLDLHEQLEGELAQFFGKEACLVFSTGYQANLGIVSGLVGRGDVVFLDKLDHASIVDGAKMSYGQTERFGHGDLAELERKIQRVPAGVGKMIIVDGVYSMEGDIADVAGLLKIAQRYGAVLAIDDAHAVGVLGPRGDGTAAHCGLNDEVDLIVGTFSKSLASIGGFVAGPEAVINFLRYNARPLVFTAALPPSNTAGVLAALHVMQREPERRDSLWVNARRLQDGLRSMGFDIGTTETPIVPFLIGEFEKTLLFWRKLFDAGVFTNPVVPPALPPSRCRLRTSVMATHTPAQIDYALETFGRLGKELGVI
ncbi:MAG TPA: aminotransferase class I/II-fold pyridoxal phosphate-dependent enzyme [Gemmatimonadales bacterium]|nr:aminotransferase class I/II-fold pyridoxal phosphate-dependent enzyme [Gemmatimonadales bacterium]